MENDDALESIMCRIGIGDLREHFRFKDIDGIHYQEITTPESLTAVGTFDVRDDDVFVCTFPKSGTHWMSEICHLIFADGYPEKILSERRSLGRIDQVLPEPIGRMTRYYRDLSPDYPRVIESHLYPHLLPTQIWEGKGKVVSVMRNPKDVIVSTQRFLLSDSNKDHDQSLFSFLQRSFFNGKNSYGSWFDFVKGFWARRHAKNVFITSYEEMTKNLRQVVQDVGQFLGRSLTAESIDRITDSASIQTMRKTFKTLADQGGENLMRAKMGGRLPYIIKGGVGSWKEHFTVKENEEFDVKYLELFQDVDIPITFEL